jgi:hypothetical protein
LPPSPSPFIFTDESGVVAHDPSQPFYGIGMIKIADVGKWHHGLNRILDRMVSKLVALKGGGVAKRTSYEFRFASVTYHTVSFHEELIDFFLAQPDGYFCGLIVDKTVPGVEPIKACGSTWDALIKYSITLLKNNIEPQENVTIVSDNFQKPTANPKYYEREVFNGLGGKALNVFMAESSASVLLQLVDVLLGCVIYDFKAAQVSYLDKVKGQLPARLRLGYGLKSLATNDGRTLRTPNYFSVWPLKPKHLIK